MKVSCRKAFTEELLNLAKADFSIVAVATDSRGSVTLDKFAKELPKQFFEIGIAEQNAVAVAAGLSLTGNNVFVCGPACFLTARSYEQIKVDAAYNKSNVKIIGVSAGVSYGPLGGTHTTLHDFAGMRCLPNIQVLAPCDNVQARALTGYLAKYNGPAYMRTGRGDVEQVYSDDDKDFIPGYARQICEGNDITIIACGEMVYFAKQASIILRENGIKARVLDMFSLKPCDENAIVKAAKETGHIITIEEHSIFGGLGELVCRVVSEKSPCKVITLGFPDEEYKVGKSAELFEYYGLTAKNIAAKARFVLKGVG